MKKKRACIKPLGAIHKTILPDRFEPDNDVQGIKKNNVCIVESVASQVRENIQLFGMQG